MSEAEGLSSGGSEFTASDGEARTTTRADLAEAIHRRTGLGRAESAKYVEMVLEEIFNSITSRDDVKLSSFGAFIIRSKRERQGRNPKTGKEAKITARLVVTFKPSNVLRARVNGVEKADGEGDGKQNGSRKAKVKGKSDGKAGDGAQDG